MQHVYRKVRKFIFALNACVLAYGALPAVQSNPKLESAYELPHVSRIARARLRAGEGHTEKPAQTEAESTGTVDGQGEQSSREPAGKAYDATEH